MNFIFEQIPAGGDRNLTYLIADRATGEAALVDPSYEPELSLERAAAQSLKVARILITHGHPDHTAGNRTVQQATGAEIMAFASSPAHPDHPLADGDSVAIGSIQVKVLHVPGHCPDHLLFYLPEEQLALTGDHLFVGKIGGTASDEDARIEYRSLRKMLDALPDETTIWPGHDYGCRPSSTIGLERRNNPFLLTEDIDAFLKLKREWSGFKATHGLK